MSLFVIVVTRDLTSVLLLPFMVINLHLVDSGGRGRILLIFFLVTSALLLLLPNFLGALSVISALSCHFLGGSRHLSLGVDLAMIFHRSLGLDFVCGGVGRSILSGDLLVGLLYIRTRS